MTVQLAIPAATRIGWIGTGVMGRWMCQHTLTAGYTATVYNRSREKAQPLLDAGAAFATSPKAVAEASERAAAQKGARLEGGMAALSSRGQDDPVETEV